MVKIPIKKINIIAESILLMLFIGCANQLPPGGGEIDKTPPEIVSVYPADGTINFNDDHIELEFSKYITKSSLNDVFFVSPSLNGKINFNWTGKSVDIEFPEPLKKNVTYVVTIGSDLEDYNNRNKMKESYTFTFSTGNHIDRGTLSGEVYDEKPSGVMIFTFIKGTKVIDPLTDKPDYISQTGSDGAYKISGLAEGEYRVFAVRDQYKDLLYQPAQDDYGCPSSDVILTKRDSALSGINFMLTKRDTIPARLLSAIMTDRYHILVRFTKDIDSAIITAENFYLADSTSNKTVIPNYAFKGTSKPEEMVLIISNELPQTDAVFLFAKTIKDEYGNEFANDNVRLTISDRADTSKPGILKSIPPNNYDNADFKEQQFIFYLTDAFNKTMAKSGITLTDTLGNSFAYSVNFLDDASFVIVPQQNLDRVKDYRISFDLSKFKNPSGNSYDTTFVYKFRTISGIDFTGISGEIKSFDISQNPIIVLQGISGSKEIYSKKIERNGKFNFVRIVAGNYNLWCYYDTDGNGEYSFGSVYPFVPAEKFFMYPSKITLKPRWTVTDISFELSH
jgi:hypothetical protein